MTETLTLIFSFISAIAGVAAVVVSLWSMKENKQYNQKLLETQNISNNLAGVTVKESQKSPERKKADNLARIGGLPHHAKYLAENESISKVKLDDK